MAKNAKKGQEEQVAPVPTGLKDLIAACEAEVPNFKYAIQKKDALTALLIAARGGDASTDATPVAEVKKEEKVAKPKKEAKKADVPVTEEEGEIDEQEKVEEEVEEEDDKKESKKPATKKGDKKAEPKKDEKKADSKKKAGTSPEDIAIIKKKPEVAAILKGGEKGEYTTSDKIRKLYQKAKLTIGDIAKVLDIHYSFAYCVVDAYRKGLLNEKKGDKK